MPKEAWAGCILLLQSNNVLLLTPSALHIVDKYVYVSDWSSHCIVVYDTSGNFVTSFGRSGHKEGDSVSPLVLMVLYIYMYVIVGMTEFRYSRINIWIFCI